MVVSMCKTFRVLSALALFLLGGCSTTEQQVDDLIANRMNRG